MKERPELKPKTDRFSYFWLLIGLLLSLFTFGAWMAPPAAWFSTLFMLRFLRTQRVLSGYLLFVLTTAAVTIYTGQGVVPFPFLLTAGFMAAQALLASLPFLADRLLAPRLPGFWGALILPLGVTAWEFINLTNSPMGSFGSQAYSQYGNLPLMQLASITGIWGITFLINWFASTVNLAWEQGFSWPAIRRGVLTYSVIFVIVLLYGYGRIVLASSATASVRVAGISAAQEDIGALMQRYQQDRTAFQQATQVRNQRYLETTVREAQAGAQVIVWPEGAIIGIGEEVAAVVAQGQALAKRQQIYLAMQTFALFPDEDRPAENKLFLVDPAGAIVLEHVKYGGNFLEGTLLGDAQLRTAASPFGLLSGVICWDADFVEVIRQAGRSGVDLLLIGANDWREIGPTHAQMAVFRAIENGVAVFRQAYNGVSIAVDPYGRLLASQDHFATTDRVLLAQMPTHSHSFTLYSVIGDALGWAALFGFLLLAGLGIFRRAGHAPASRPMPPQSAPATD